MLHIVFAAAEVILFLILTYFFHGKKQEKLFLILFGIGAIPVNCISLFYAPEEIVSWLRIIYWIMPMFCVFRLDRISRKKK